MSIFVGAAYRVRTHAAVTQTPGTNALTGSATSTPYVYIGLSLYFMSKIGYFNVNFYISSNKNQDLNYNFKTGIPLSRSQKHTFKI